jgi:hypothetical protein
MRRITVIIVASALVVACGGGTTTPSTAPVEQPTQRPAATPSGNISVADFGDDWPFTVQSGTLSCQESRGQPVATFTDNENGIMWALNGVAISAGFPELDDTIWLDNPSTAGKVPISDLIRRALALC